MVRHVGHHKLCRKINYFESLNSVFKTSPLRTG
jgi:hypothetical protein